MSACSLSDASHHREELLEVNLAIAVHVHLRDGLIKLILCVHVSELITGKELQKFAGVDLPTAIAVKHLEGSLEVRLSRVGLSVHRGRQKLYKSQQEAYRCVK